MRIYIDADVVIWHLRGDPQAGQFFQELFAASGDEPWMGAMQRAEIVFHMRPGEVKRTTNFLALFQTAAIDQATVDLGADFYRRWHPSHGIDVNDALLAATALLNDGRIICLHLKHYPTPEVRVAKAW